MECPNCRGTGRERAYEPWEDCQECDGSGTVYSDDDDRDTDWIAEEDHFLYSVPIGSPVDG